MQKINPFHLAIPVSNLAECRRFYGEIMQCAEGRSDTHWVDFDFYGHQLVIHEVPAKDQPEEADHNPVDGHDVPVPHFGVVLDWDVWHDLAERLRASNIQFTFASRENQASRRLCFLKIHRAMHWNSNHSKTLTSFLPNNKAINHEKITTPGTFYSTCCLYKHSFSGNYQDSKTQKCHPPHRRRHGALTGVQRLLLQK